MPESRLHEAEAGFDFLPMSKPNPYTHQFLAAAHKWIIKTGSESMLKKIYNWLAVLVVLT